MGGRQDSMSRMSKEGVAPFHALRHVAPFWRAFKGGAHLPFRPFRLEFGRNLTSCYRSFTTFRSDNYFNATPPCARFAKPGGGVPTGSSACRFRARRGIPEAVGLGFPLYVKTLESMDDSRVTQFTEFM